MCKFWLDLYKRQLQKGAYFCSVKNNITADKVILQRKKGGALCYKTITGKRFYLIKSALIRAEPICR